MKNKTLKITHSGKTVSLTLNDPEHVRNIEKTGVFLEHWMLAEIEKRGVDPESTIIDVGANCGNHTVFFASYLNAKKVISFEPDQDTFKVLQKNLLDNSELTNSDVQLFNLGVGSESYKARVKKGERSGLNQVNKHGRGNIEVISLDSMLDELEKVSIIKIDVEGMELDVLEGAKELIDRDKPDLYVETNDPASVSKYLPRGYVPRKRFNNAPTWFFKFNEV